MLGKLTQREQRGSDTAEVLGPSGSPTATDDHIGKGFTVGSTMILPNAPSKREIPGMASGSVSMAQVRLWTLGIEP
jgi:hypothetical protein